MFWRRLLASPKSFLSWVKWSKEKIWTYFYQKNDFFVINMGLYPAPHPGSRFITRLHQDPKIHGSVSTTRVKNSEKNFITWSRAHTARRSEPRPQQSEPAYYISLQAAKTNVYKIKKKT